MGTVFGPLVGAFHHRRRWRTISPTRAVGHHRASITSSCRARIRRGIMGELEAFLRKRRKAELLGRNTATTRR